MKYEDIKNKKHPIILRHRSSCPDAPLLTITIYGYLPPLVIFRLAKYSLCTAIGKVELLPEDEFDKMTKDFKIVS